MTFGKRWGALLSQPRDESRSPVTLTKERSHSVLKRIRCERSRPRTPGRIARSRTARRFDADSHAALLERAAMGSAGVVAASTLLPIDAALAGTRRDRSHTESISDWGVFASTTDALTVTIVAELVRRARKQSDVPRSVSVIFDGVYAAERDHWLFISKHWHPSTTRFWIPDGFFGGAGDALDLPTVGKSVADGEHLFINTYLLGVTKFAAAGRQNYARYAAELAATESEHRLLGKTLAGANPPNDQGFAEFQFNNVDQLKGALTWAGFGFGEQGSAPGRFYDLPRPPMAASVQIASNVPR